MRTLSILALASLGAGLLSAQAPPSPPPVSAFLMPRDAELALARSAAPATVTEHATFKVLTPTGFQVAQEGRNGFTCLVLRGWSAPTYTPAPFRDLVYDPRVRAPICYNPVASRTVLPYQELRTKLAMAGSTPDQIAQGVSAAYAHGELPSVTETGIAYMWSADMYLASGVGAFHPHMMVFIPYNDNARVGGNPFGGMAPFLSDDAGTPFAVTVIPVDPALAIRVHP
jgi:hypothetical protein